MIDNKYEAESLLKNELINSLYEEIKKELVDQYFKDGNDSEIAKANFYKKQGLDLLFIKLKNLLH